jgi:hypothetical protein
MRLACYWRRSPSRGLFAKLSLVTLLHKRAGSAPRKRRTVAKHRLLLANVPTAKHFVTPLASVFSLVVTHARYQADSRDAGHWPRIFMSTSCGFTCDRCAPRGTTAGLSLTLSAFPCSTLSYRRLRRPSSLSRKSSGQMKRRLVTPAVNCACA